MKRFKKYFYVVIFFFIVLFILLIFIINPNQSESSSGGGLYIQVTTASTSTLITDPSGEELFGQALMNIEKFKKENPEVYTSDTSCNLNATGTAKGARAAD